MNSKKKNRLGLALEIPDCPSLDIRRQILHILSDGILGINSETRVNVSRKSAFALSKLWSTQYPPKWSSNWRGMNAEVEKGDDVCGDVNALMDFHCPLLGKYVALLDDTISRVVGWSIFKSDVCSLGPMAWEQCREKIPKEAAASLDGILRYLSRVSERLRETCIEDTRLVNRLFDLSRKPRSGSRSQYNETHTARRVNVVEMNRCLSLMHLFYFLFEIGQCSGLDVVKDFFQKKIGDRKALEGYCRVLDVDAQTERYIVYDDEGEPAKLIYMMAECDLPSSQQEEEDEGAWWIWVEKLLRDFQSQTDCYNLQEVNEAMRIVRRIDKGFVKTAKITEALHEMWYDKLYCMDLDSILNFDDGEM